MLKGYALVLVDSYLILGKIRDAGDLEEPHPFQVDFQIQILLGGGASHEHNAISQTHQARGA